MTSSNGDSGVPGSSYHVTCSSCGAGSSHGGGSRGLDARRECDIPKYPDSESDTDSGDTKYPDSDEGDPFEFSTECLSGVLPYFEVELTKTHVASRYRLLMPRTAIRLLPAVEVAVTLRHGLKEWKGIYHGSYKRPVISKTAWQPFVDDNHLKAGDICTFELQKLCDSCGVGLKVLLLKDIFSPLAERLA